MAQVRVRRRNTRKASIEVEADRRVSKTDMSALFRLFLGYRAEKKVTTRNSPANPLAVFQPEMQPIVAVVLQTLGRTVVGDNS